MDFTNWPKNVVYCKTCVMSNNRPASIIEFQHTPDRKNSKYLTINEDGECDACKQSKIKNEINWKLREEELLRLLDKHRRSDGGHDCIVPEVGEKIVLINPIS